MLIDISVDMFMCIFIDMLVDMSEKSYIEIDGETIQKDGEFLF